MTEKELDVLQLFLATGLCLEIVTAALPPDLSAVFGGPDFYTGRRAQVVAYLRAIPSEYCLLPMEKRLARGFDAMRKQSPSLSARVQHEPSLSKLEWCCNWYQHDRLWNQEWVNAYTGLNIRV